MSAAASVTPLRVGAADDTLELLFNENDGILSHEASLASSSQQPVELDAIISSILSDQRLLNATSDDLDLDELLQGECPPVDVMEELLNPPPEDADSCTGSPPLLAPAALADPDQVSRDHSYLCSDDRSYDFAPLSDSSPSPPADVPVYLGESSSPQRAAPGPMRHARRCRSSGSGSSLPYTVQDLAPPSPSSFEEDSSRGRRSNAGSDDGALGSPGDLLLLTDEERLLLAREGVDLPDRLPLTREEERALRTVRRKIRNKISAKNSRLKKQEYVSGLEQRVKLCSRENRSLRGAVDSLRAQNRQLGNDLRRLRSWISARLPAAQLPFNPAGKVAFYTLMLSFAFVLTPMLSPFWSAGSGHAEAPSPAVLPGRSRTLLQEKSTQLGPPYLITVRPMGSPWQQPPKSPAIPLPPHRAANVSESGGAREEEEEEEEGPVREL